MTTVHYLTLPLFFRSPRGLYHLQRGPLEMMTRCGRAIEDSWKVRLSAEPRPDRRSWPRPLCGTCRGTL